MTSNLMSRFMPINSSTTPSIYETLQQYDNDSDGSDIEHRAGMAVDEENLGDQYADYELEDALAQASDSQSQQSSPYSRRSRSTRGKRGWGNANMTVTAQGARVEDAEEADDEVPASLLVEGNAMPSSPLPPPPLHPLRSSGIGEHSLHLRGPSTIGQTRNRWETRAPSIPSHGQEGPPRVWGVKQHAGLAFADPKEKALWRWANVENLDNFLQEVYDYFLGNGIWSIMLSRTLSLITLAFVVGFTTFLSSCIDYRKVPHSKTMPQILIPGCVRKMSGFSTFLLWLFTIFWIGKLFQYAVDFRRLRHMQDFYQHLLGIPDADIQTVSWQEVVSRLMALRDSNPSTAAAVSAKHRRFLGSQSKQRMDAHDIANRLMRRENYLIALFNKDILDLTLPLPFLRSRQLFSRTLEWNLNLCVLDYAFNQQGQLRPLFLKDTHRKALSDGLRRRFILAGFMNIFVAPFIVTYFLMHYFFRYFSEYQKNPSQIGSRQYTPLAEWKFREFNELWHLFERRTNMSRLAANEYIAQFPKDKTVQFARFVAFIASALASVLALATIIDPELFLGFEITHDRTALFYLGIFGSVWAVAQGVIPAENLVFDPELALRRVIEFTHYQPTHWQGRLHSDDIKKEFALLYQMKLVIFLEEILSMIFTPFVLWFSLPKCSDRLIDFFREFTVHVDGLGYVCSFAVFDFKKGNNVILQDRDDVNDGARPAGPQGLRNDYYSTKDGKMLASYYGFLDHYSSNPTAGGTHAYMLHRRQNPQSTAQPAAYNRTNSGDLGMDKYDRGPQRSMHRMPPGLGMANLTSPPREPALGGPISPLPSMLLDPHHQPSASGFRSINRPPGPSSRARPSRQTNTMRDAIPDADESQANTPRLSAQQSNTQRQAHTASSSKLATEDSQLEESWRMNLAADVDDDEEEHDEDINEVVEGAGVLGLIQQFQMVGNEGRRAVGM
ncbi:Autophagy-related protein 9 [Arthroderma uncinatum]|uniref:Autophagy-related protein 9 n=1 Tax=Arthroderma uncinatum TaxID=74035 RepID=UPI00144A9D2E|nr:Autophagy-related protein 9 [Arthroderma uncinatum]KAF3490508.1 Autophagy-related protein 9 [Arthroderma uncinatum]